MEDDFSLRVSGTDADVPSRRLWVLNYQINVPTLLAIMGTFLSAVIYVRGLDSRIDENKKDIGRIEGSMELLGNRNIGSLTDIVDLRARVLNLERRIDTIESRRRSTQ